MTSPTDVDGTCSARPIRGAAVVTIVPSRFSMKKQPATSRAMRCVGVTRSCVMTGRSSEMARAPIGEAYDEAVSSLGLVLLVIGALVAVAEAHYPTHGIAGGLGVVVMARRRRAGDQRTGRRAACSGCSAVRCWPALAPGAVLLSVRKGGRGHRRRVRTGAEGLIGQIGDRAQLGRLRPATSLSGGALWQACRSAAMDDDEPCDLHAGDPSRGRAAQRADPVGAPGRGMGAAAVITAIIVVVVRAAGGRADHAGQRGARPARVRARASCSGSAG